MLRRARIESGRPRTTTNRAFTLIEVLVVVAIIALLAAILLPSLYKARELSRRGACLSNLNQQGNAMVMYGEAFGGQLPSRGWWSYDLAETLHEAFGPPGSDEDKTLINLGLLHGDDRKPQYISFIGKEWDVLYCPSLIPAVRDMAPNYGAEYPNGGLATRWDGEIKWTHAGYDYAFPVAKRTSGFGLNKKCVYPRETLSRQWIIAVGQAQGLPVDERNFEEYRGVIHLHPMQAVSVDWGIGGHGLTHGDGMNALYSDGHAKFHRLKSADFLSDQMETHEMWLYLTTYP